MFWLEAEVTVTAFAMQSAGSQILGGSGPRPIFRNRGGVFALGPLLVLLLLCRPNISMAKGPQAKHLPQQPKTGESVNITVEFAGKAAPASCYLEYQIVEPGKYIALQDPDFERDWTRVEMQPSNSDRSLVAGSRVFAAQIQAEVQKHRRLVRYRIRSSDDSKVIAPQAGDAQPNFAYFVYDGVPEWKGAINPNSNDNLQRRPVTYSRQALERVPVYHFISSKPAVEKATWLEPAAWGEGEARNQYKYTGTMVYEGVVYDHISFRARGGEWRHAMGKNMWKFNFLSGHHFHARDDYGIAYAVKWDKLNLGACIQQGDTHMRGEAGMFEAIAFRLFNLAGVAAPHTHWVQLRIIDQAEESPRDQYSGDFWGLYLAVENVDGHFLREHDLPEGNLYKIQSWRPKTAFNGDRAITNQSDVLQFMSQVMRGAQTPTSWWEQNVDLSSYYGYRSVIECIHHYDLDMGKNFFFYLNPSLHRWDVVPWDTDLTWSDHVFGRGYEPYFRTGLLRRAPFKEHYQERLAEIRDLLYNPEPIGLLIDEYARFIDDSAGAPSIVDADRAKWDYHPILASPLVLPKKAGQGRFYFSNPTNRFPVMVDYMKSYARERAQWVDQTLLADYQPPAAPTLAPDGASKPGERARTFRIQSTPDPGFKKVEWRLAEITDPKTASLDPHQPWKYEVEALWQKQLDQEKAVTLPANLIVAGHSYRVRARWAGNDGQWSRWSKPVQFVAQN